MTAPTDANGHQMKTAPAESEGLHLRAFVNNIGSGERFKAAAAVAVVACVAREFHLSRRETQVLLAAAVGQCTKQMAADLGISGKTVEYFWSRIFKKLRCKSQLEVMALLLSRAC
jgi:DNA-binding NarL/FixJ family response regulator